MEVSASSLAGKSASLPPLHERLPTELVCKIFECFSELRNENHGNISLVCRHWRNLSLSTPALWRYYAIRYRIAHHRDGDRISEDEKIANHTTSQLIESASIWLNRSDPLPCVLAINLNFMGGPGYNAWTLSSLKLFNPFLPDISRRLKVLELSSPMIFIPTLLELLPQELPQLVELSVNCIYYSHRENQFFILPNTANFVRSQISVVKFVADCRDIGGFQRLTVHDSLASIFPWGKITVFVLSDVVIPTIDFLSVLSQCSEIETCRVEIVPGASLPSTTVSTVGSIHLPKLCVLDILNDVGLSVEHWFPRLSLPALQELCINQKTVDPLRNRTTFAQTLLRMLESGSFRALTKLAIINIGMDCNQVLSLFGQLPDLEEVKVQFCRVLDDQARFLLSLALPAVGLLPKLRVLHVEESRQERVTPSRVAPLLKAMIESRSGGSSDRARIQKVSILDGASLPIPTIYWEMLSELRQKDTDLELRYRHHV